MRDICVALTERLLPVEVTFSRAPLLEQAVKAYAVAFYPAKQNKDRTILLNTAFLVVRADGRADCAPTPSAVCKILEQTHPDYAPRRKTCNGWAELAVEDDNQEWRFGNRKGVTAGWLTQEVRADAISADDADDATEEVQPGAPPKVHLAAEESLGAEAIRRKVERYMDLRVRATDPKGFWRPATRAQVCPETLQPVPVALPIEFRPAPLAIQQPAPVANFEEALRRMFEERPEEFVQAVLLLFGGDWLAQGALWRAFVRYMAALPPMFLAFVNDSIHEVDFRELSEHEATLAECILRCFDAPLMGEVPPEFFDAQPAPEEVAAPGQQGGLSEEEARDFDALLAQFQRR